MTFQFMTSNLRQCTFQLKSLNLQKKCLLNNVTHWPFNPQIYIYYEISQEKGAMTFQLTTTGLRQSALSAKVIKSTDKVSTKQCDSLAI
jgi:hypothetical protein